MKEKTKNLTRVGFEPTPADADEKPLIRGKLSLESHTLDHSVISPCEDRRAVGPRRALPSAALESFLGRTSRSSGAKKARSCGIAVLS